MLGIRPEHIELSESSDGIPASVNVVEPMGDETVVYAQIGGQGCTVKLNGDLEIDSDDDLELSFREDKIHLFDRNTGDAIPTKRSLVT